MPAESREGRFREAYDAYGRAIYAYAYQLTRSEAEAEDVHQETFLRLWRELGRGEIAAVRPWLYRVASRVTVDRKRRERSRPLLDVWESPERKEDLDAALELVADLPRDDRAAVILFELHEFTLREIAEMQGVPAGTLKVRLFRAREKMRERWSARQKEVAT